MEFPNYKIIVETDQWPGNFNREMQLYVFGFKCDDFYGDQHFVEEFPKKYEEWLEKDDCPLFIFYNEYGQTSEEIVNDTDLEFYFTESPVPFWDVISKRIKQFPNKCKEILKKEKYFGFPGDLKIKKISIVSYSEITETVVETIKL